MRLRLVVVVMQMQLQHSPLQHYQRTMFPILLALAANNHSHMTGSGSKADNFKKEMMSEVARQLQMEVEDADPSEALPLGCSEEEPKPQQQPMEKEESETTPTPNGPTTGKCGLDGDLRSDSDADAQPVWNASEPHQITYT